MYVMFKFSNLVRTTLPPLLLQLLALLSPAAARDNTSLPLRGLPRQPRTESEAHIEHSSKYLQIFTGTFSKDFFSQGAVN